MASNSKKTKAIRKKKARPNKRNINTDDARIRKNLEILKELASKEAS